MVNKDLVSKQGRRKFLESLLVNGVISEEDFADFLSSNIADSDLAKHLASYVEYKKSTSEIPKNAFILRSDDHFGLELVTKTNELFENTAARIATEYEGEVRDMLILKRLALITTLYTDSNLRSANLWPITPLQSELLLKAGELPEPTRYSEASGLILWSLGGCAPKSANCLYESIKEHRNDLGLEEEDLKERLLIVNAGLELVDKGEIEFGVKPVVLPGLTKVYIPEVLDLKTSPHFTYGLNQGLPSSNELGRGERMLYIPSDNWRAGLSILTRAENLNLWTIPKELNEGNGPHRVVFARQN